MGSSKASYTKLMEKRDRLKELESASLMALGYLKGMNADDGMVKLLAKALSHTECDYVKAMLEERSPEL